MADSGDQRTVGARNTKHRRDYYQRKSTGVCTYCGSTPVLGRSVCFSCSRRQSLHTAFWGFRATLRLCEVNPAEAYRTVEKARSLRGLSVEERAVLRDLLHALELGLPTRQPKVKRRAKLPQPRTGFSGYSGQVGGDETAWDGGFSG